MPGIARKIIICAAVDGLIIQPFVTKGQRPAQPVRIKYGDASITPAPREQIPDLSQPNSSFEAFGVIGLITVSRLSYLITITRRQQVAQICGFPIYVVTEVAITPCASQQEAGEAIAKTALELQDHKTDKDAGDSDSDDYIELPASGDEVEDPAQEAKMNSDKDLETVKSTVAKDVIGRRGSYGRFAQTWFSKSGWTQDQKRSAGWSGAAHQVRRSVDHSPVKNAPPRPSVDEATKPTTASTLLPKLLRMTQIFYGSSKSFFFSYDFDITRRWSSRSPAESDEVPLHERVDPIFFWNKNTLKPFMEAGEDALLLPLMQGFVSQKSFVVDSSPPQHDEGLGDSVELSNMKQPDAELSSPPPETVRDSIDLRSTEKKFLLTVISRRSTQRAGLRYLRRGIDEQGYVANAVETEQILSSTSWDKSSKIYSFLQIRGSIPLFFTQSPVSLKPAPVIQHSPEANYAATKKHLERLKTEYGLLQIVNLVEKHGVEATVGGQYEKTVQRLNEEEAKGEHDTVGFEWFDFHSACKGMKFENVSQLLDTLRDKLEGFGSTVEDAGQITTKQQGVLRTNCMDCLDRTNVCQSSFGKFMLESQLRAEGYDLAAQVDQQTQWFNTLWADNGDAVSKQYASTAAMKGDYTRTKKRNLGGTLNDLGLSLTRYYNGMVNDYFSQAAIDFLLGNVNSMVFQEFEAEMMTKDPAVSMLKMREQAIELSQRRVISDEGEEFMGGWVLFSPHQSDSLRAMPFEEVVLLLTDAALYLCRFDWNMDKVSSFERIDLAHVVGIKFGTYIISTVSPGQTDEMKNVGFVVSYQPGKNDVTRTNTRTFSNLGITKTKTDAVSSEQQQQQQQQKQPQSALSSLLGGGGPKAPPVRKLAFKAPYSQSSAAVTGEEPKLSEIQQVVSICADIERLAFLSQPGKERPGTESIIEKGDIISLEEARQSTGLLDHISYSLKRLVWA
ncbi:SacI homology domain-containing protein [Colletotrichum godetiae]|uniref:SacI homology domain-containing protein n=1 Tax=Colletotrichum godetiae TaxID=1209918 RepID=A0AAJ0AZP5_9PEZI|nr:inositol 5'-phosphatase [Colletotrichum godetiae]KAK1700781.1 SacI homology domain-containing protein [Colletotrichum godetiae]